MATEIYTYAVPEDVDGRELVGRRVRVPFGRRQVTGFIVGASSVSSVENPRPLSSILDGEPLLDEIHLELAGWIAGRYRAPLAEVLRAMLPARVRAARSNRPAKPRVRSTAVDAAVGDGAAEPPLSLSPDQHRAVDRIVGAIDGHQHRAFLLHGVTGSGKTEVYLASISAALARGRQAIVLVPEIALTPQTIRRFAARFPGRLAVLHSGLTDAERAQQWRAVRSGQLTVVVGSRSAIFAPVPELGIVILDEEDAAAYKQDRTPRYHAADVAVELGRLARAPVILGSATPRIEAFWGAHTGRFELLSLPQRIGGRSLPSIEIVDLREELRAGNRSSLSIVLQRALVDCHAAGGQTILFLNRRGTSTVILCRSCGATLTCDHCSVAMVYHHGRARCDCHYCGATRPLPDTCPACGSSAIRGLGGGTERLEGELRELFPTLRLLRMDRDTTVGRDAHHAIYDAFRRGEADCLVGTQMIAKGWDLGNVRLVGIVNADIGLHLPDYRSGETTFSLITQVAGRTGRGDHPARVVLQTYSPDHYAVRFASTHDYLGFARAEARIRRSLAFPPFSRLVVCTVADEDDARAESEARRAVSDLLATIPPGSGLAVLGPTPAFIHRLRGDYRWQFTVRGEMIEPALPLLPTGRRWSVDVDPGP